MKKDPRRRPGSENPVYLKQKGRKENRIKKRKSELPVTPSEFPECSGSEKKVLIFTPPTEIVFYPKIFETAETFQKRPKQSRTYP